jgi:hypothetical protein
MDMETNSPQAARRLDHFVDCQLAIDTLFHEAAESQDALAAMERFLSKAADFSNLSIYNAMLVEVQRPGALAVASPGKWEQIGRSIKIGARPVVILKAFGPVEFVYEHADTDGAPMEGSEANTLLASGTPTVFTLKDMVKAAGAHGVTVEEDQRAGALLAGTAHQVNAAMTARVRGVPQWIARMNASYDEPSKFATLAHELAHIYCGHLGEGANGAWPDRSKLRHHECEVEAEAAAWLVCRRNNVDTKSAAYLLSHLPRANLRSVSMYAIFEAANRIESRTVRRVAGAVTAGLKS